MKKIIAIMLSAIMLFALCVPVFATVNSNAGPLPDGRTSSTIDHNYVGAEPQPNPYIQTGDGVVKTTYAPTDYSYTVTFPAETPITWGDTLTQDISYSVDCQLLVGASLDVVVENSAISAPTKTGTIPMNNAVTTVTDKLNLTVNNLNETTTFTGAVAGGSPTNNITVSIPSFAGVAIGDYQTSFTYQVTYNAPTP